MSIQVKSFMKNPVITCTLPEDVGNVRDLMTQKGIHAIPLVDVEDNGRVTIRGIVTSDDLVGVYDDTVDIQQVMTQKVHVVNPQSNAQSAAKMMIRHNTHHLVAMEDGKIVGMVSSLDFVELIAEQKI
ncbi:MAG: CBS domain-containing protein [Saprospiraceae bacterium]|nr:CBS domain-containing protein [Saprospiraceae bacterium]